MGWQERGGEQGKSDLNVESGKLGASLGSGEKDECRLGREKVKITVGVAEKT